MRGVENTWYKNFLYNLDLVKSRYDTAITQSTTGKKLNNLSDNPSDISFVLGLRNKIEQLNQFNKNIETGVSFLKASETALDSTQKMILRAITLAEQGASESNEGEAREIIADEIEEIRIAILNNANTQLNGRFLFAGSAITTTPFADNPGGVVYNGNNDSISIQAEFSITVPINIPGDEAFMGATDIFDRLATLRDALIADDTATIGASISSMKDIVEQLNESIGRIGNRTGYLQDLQGSIREFKNSLTVRMSSLEDADLADAITNLKKEEVALSALLQIGARINNYSLMNFMA
jgi:flagellar hook-associated protein 3 FlgL